MRNLVKHFVNPDFWEKQLMEFNLLRNWAKNIESQSTK